MLDGMPVNEVVEDATLMAARMMDSAEKAGKTFTVGNMSCYAVKAASAVGAATIPAAAM